MLDFDIRLIHFGSNYGIVGKPVRCNLIVSDSNSGITDPFSISFEGEGVIVIGEKVYPEKETFEYDFRENNILVFDFIPSAEGDHLLTIIAKHRNITHSEILPFTISKPLLKTKFIDMPPEVTINETIIISLSLVTNLEEVTVKTRFIRGAGTVLINGVHYFSGSAPLQLNSNNTIKFWATQRDQDEMIAIEFMFDGIYEQIIHIIAFKVNE
jgi:hypothetical protein